MGRKNTLINELQKFKRNLSKSYPVSKLLLFGSQVEGNITKESDVDLVIVSAAFRNLNYIKRASAMYDFWDLRIPVDFLCYTPEEFRKLSKKITIVQYAVKHGIVI